MIDAQPSSLDSAAALCLMAAMADGAINPREQEHIQLAIRAIADAGAADGAAASPGPDAYQRVMLGRADLSREAANIIDPDLRHQVHELAIAICAADGATSAAERDFLTRLARALSIDPVAADTARLQADTLAAAAGSGLAVGAAPMATPVANSADKELDDMILNASILNGALELLPQSFASMAIIPMQMRLVYRIGARHGHSLDRGHITEFLGVLGVGATSQIIESVAGRLLGGLFKSASKQVLGKTVGSLAGRFGRSAGGAMMTFATTYALGQVARQYYAGGRSLASVDLKRAFDSQLGSAQDLATRYLPQIQSQAQNLNPAQLISLARGQIGV